MSTIDNLRWIFIFAALFIVTAVSSQEYSDHIDILVLKNLFEKNEYCQTIHQAKADQTSTAKNRSKAALYSLLCYDNTKAQDSLESFTSKYNIDGDHELSSIAQYIKSTMAYNSDNYKQSVDIANTLLADRNIDKRPYLKSYVLICLIYNYYSSYTENLAIKYSRELFSLGESLDKVELQLEALDMMTNSYLRLDSIAKADSLRLAYSAIAHKSGKPEFIYYDLLNSAYRFQKLEKFDSASIYFEQALELTNQYLDSIKLINMLVYLGENATWAEDYQQALVYFDRLEGFPDSYKVQSTMHRAYRLRVDAEAGVNNFAEAYEYFSKYILLDETYWSINTQDQLIQYEAKYQSVIKDAEIVTRELELERSTTQRNLAYLSLLGVFLLSSFLYYRYNKNQRLAKYKIVNLEKQQKLMALDYMVQGQEEERKRIAQDLHDGLGGLLSTARLQIQNVQAEIKKLGEMNLLSEAELMIDNACSEVRRISHDMMPGALMDLGLIDALEDLAAKAMSEYPILISITHNLEDVTLIDKTKVQLYRIFQEMMNNTLKHAEASNINIDLLANKTHLTIQYKDDGKGFDGSVDQSKAGLGLKNIESRVRYLSGIQNCISGLGQGVLFDINIPLNISNPS